VERLMIMSAGEEIQVTDIPPAILSSIGNRAAGLSAPAGAGVTEFGEIYKDAKDAFERAFLKAQLERNQWNVSKTAEVIKLERSNLHKKIKQFKIEMG
jgi:two-component system nitrogen regulation response regulator NtrX